MEKEADTQDMIKNNNNMTAKKFLRNKKYPPFTNDGGLGTVYVKEAMIEFAKYHVEQALKEAYKNNVIKTITKQHKGVVIKITNVVESSIINAYSLENIK